MISVMVFNIDIKMSNARIFLVFQVLNCQTPVTLVLKILPPSMACVYHKFIRVLLSNGSKAVA